MYFRSWDPAVSTRGGGDDNATKDWLNPEKAMLVTFKDREQRLVMVWITWSWCFPNNFTSIFCEFLVWSDQISSQNDLTFWILQYDSCCYFNEGHGLSNGFLLTQTCLAQPSRPRGYEISSHFQYQKKTVARLHSNFHLAFGMSTCACCVCVFFWQASKQSIKQVQMVSKKVNKSTKHDLNIFEYCKKTWTLRCFWQDWINPTFFSGMMDVYQFWVHGWDHVEATIIQLLRGAKKFSPCPCPIPSMYGIVIYIHHTNQPNVGKYTIGGSIWILWAICRMMCVWTRVIVKNL